MMIPYVKAFDIVGYTYQADNYCPGCVHVVMGFEQSYRWASDPEEFLNLTASHRGIDRMDEYSFDSGDFPKVIFASMVEDDEHCGNCGGVL